MIQRDWSRRAAIVGIALGLLGSSCRRAPAISPDRVYKIGYDHNPPYQIDGPDGKVRGLAVDAVSAAARRAGIRLAWVKPKVPFDVAFRSGEVDLWPLLADVPERHAFAHISEPWLLWDTYLIVRGTSDDVPPPDFAGDMYYSGPQLYVSLIHGVWPRAHTILYADSAGVAGALCKGELPIIFLNSSRAIEILTQTTEMCADAAFRPHQLPNLTVRMGVGSTHEAAAVADRLRAEILEMGKNGELGTIMARYAYTGLNESHMVFLLAAAERQSRVLAIALTILAVALVVLVVLGRHLRRARHEAQQASIAKSEFLANMSHEIRTPMAGVIGMIDLALEDATSDEQRELLVVARSSARSLLAILNDILDFSRIEARRLELAPTDFDVRQVVSEVIGLTSPLARDKALVVETDVAASVPAFIRADAARLKQVLLNLVGNAAKFTERGSIKVRVARAEGALRLGFQVSDTGIGIAASRQGEVFEPFRQADSTIVRRFGGSGLGLAISRQLVELMGGQITCVSTPGWGSTFSFTVPFSEASAPREERAAAERSRPLPTRPLRLLLAEDDRVNRQLIRALLQRDGHQVTVVGSGREAVATVKSGALLDAILMDIQMPEMDGFEATAAIRATSAGADLWVVALTAYAEVGYEQKCLEAGMDSYLSKPIDRERLRDVLAAVAAGGPRGPVPAALPVIDLPPTATGVVAPGEEQALLDLFDGDREAVRELAALFLDEAPRYVARIRRAVEDRDNAALKQALHSLNGAAGNFGAADLRRAVEALGDTGNLEERSGRERGQERFRALELRLGGLCDLLRKLTGVLASPTPDPAVRPT